MDIGEGKILCGDRVLQKIFLCLPQKLSYPDCTISSSFSELPLPGEEELLYLDLNDRLFSSVLL